MPQRAVLEKPPPAQPQFGLIPPLQLKAILRFTSPKFYDNDSGPLWLCCPSSLTSGDYSPLLSREHNFIGLWRAKLQCEATGSRVEAFSQESAILPDFLYQRNVSGSEQKPQECELFFP